VNPDSGHGSNGATSGNGDVHDRVVLVPGQDGLTGERGRPVSQYRSPSALLRGEGPGVVDVDPGVNDGQLASAEQSPDVPRARTELVELSSGHDTLLPVQQLGQCFLIEAGRILLRRGLVIHAASLAAAWWCKPAAGDLWTTALADGCAPVPTRGAAAHRSPDTARTEPNAQSITSW